MIRRMIQTAAACYYQPDTEKRWIRPAIEATVKLCAQKAAERHLGYCEPVIGMDRRATSFRNNGCSLRTWTYGIRSD